MAAVLSRPLPAPWLAAATVALALAVASYCLAYAWLAGRPERIDEALVWAAANVVPWFFAFEAAKRARSPLGRRLALAAGFGVATIFGAGPEASASQAGFEAVRHVPPLLLVAGLLWLGRRRSEASDREISEGGALPLPADQIERVEAAGNYVEFRRRSGPVLVHRASLAAIERELAGHGFVRIHRSHLVRRDAIVRIRPADVILRDGTSLRTGKRFRTTLRG